MASLKFLGFILFLATSGCGVANDLKGDFTPGDSIAEPNPETPSSTRDNVQILSAGRVNVSTSGGYILNLSLGGNGNSQQSTAGGYTIDLTTVGLVR